MPQTHKTHPANAIGHFDIAGPDIGPLSEFYAALFGWHIENRGPGYAAIETPAGGPNGALVENQTPSLVVGIVVADLERALTTATERGGSIVMPKLDNGWVKKAQIRDPAGNVLTLIQG